MIEVKKIKKFSDPEYHVLEDIENQMKKSYSQCLDFMIVSSLLEINKELTDANNESI